MPGGSDLDPVEIGQGRVPVRLDPDVVATDDVEVGVLRRRLDGEDGAGVVVGDHVLVAFRSADQVVAGVFLQTDPTRAVAQVRGPALVGTDVVERDGVVVGCDGHTVLEPGEGEPSDGAAVAPQPEGEPG